MNAFQWPVVDAGYRWAKVRHGDQTREILTAMAAWPKHLTVPLATKPGLFLEFARLGQTKAKILPWANENGHLGDFLRIHGGDMTLHDAQRGESLNAGMVSRYPEGLLEACEKPETLDLWLEQIRLMNRLVQTWIGIREKRIDPCETARVVESINNQLWRRGQARLHYDDGSRSCAWRVVPHDLLGALWLQFSEALIGHRATKTCPICHRVFWIVEGERSDKALCSVACRQRAYRDRKERAIVLARESPELSPNEIAQKLGTTVASVEAWLKAAGIPIVAAITRPLREIRPLDL